MPTVNFSVPEDVKEAFNATFEGQNKSAVIADLMREAVERAQSQQRSKDAFQRILARRQIRTQRHRSRVSRCARRRPPMMAVVDAGVAVKWFLSGRPDEQHADLALQILEQSVLGFLPLVQPSHFVAEVSAVLARLKPADARDDLSDLLDISYRTHATLRPTPPRWTWPCVTSITCLTRFITPWRCTLPVPC